MRVRGWMHTRMLRIAVPVTAVGLVLAGAGAAMAGTRWDAIAADVPSGDTGGTGTELVAQTITFAALDPAPPGGTAALAASASSGLPVSYSVDPTSTVGACRVTGKTVRFVRVGTCVLDADQPGDSTYRAAARVQRVVAVTAAPGRQPA